MFENAGGDFDQLGMDDELLSIVGSKQRKKRVEDSLMLF
jgi:hypothetical protein